MRIFCKKTSVLILYLLLFSQGYAQKRYIEKKYARMVYEVTSESTIHLEAVYNKDENNSIEISVDASSVGTIKAGGSLLINKNCQTAVKVVMQGETKEVLWHSGDTADEWKNLHPAKENVTEEKNIELPVVKEEPVIENSKVLKVSRTKIIPVNQIVSMFKESLEKDTFYSSIFAQTFRSEVGKHADLMSDMKTKESREDYIQKYQLREYFNDKEIVITRMENGIDSHISNFIITNFNANELPNRSEYETKLRNILEERISERKDILDEFSSKILGGDFTTFDTKRLFSGESVIINIAVVFFVICLALLIILLIRKANKKKKASKAQTDVIRSNAQTDIVVRRKTTSILKKQSLEDVQYNNAYLKIDCADFCQDSAVRRIYVKNTCIKDIYNLYAEDLRNPDNPKEDGCMVLGRWVHDEQNDEYYVSLEEIVKPGDDAIFKEYELNFGGKIKLKVSERLRRLRRETNLQYDMTCWVHSHPGLGVFFSNADSSVQMQLKHPTHPKFLVAMVIDILTPEQELGIFTFRHDLSINSKADLKRMYSLEELHKWAVESNRTSFKPEDYRNIMQKAIKRMESHYGIELSNGAIIDMCQLQTDYENGLLAWAHGYTCEKNGRIEYVLTSVSQEKIISDNELLGCYINGSHCSIPTIKRIISNELRNMKFILFYSTSEDVLTAIPVVDGLLSMDENCYGEEKLEELKIWTRRKR